MKYTAGCLPGSTLKIRGAYLPEVGGSRYPVVSSLCETKGRTRKRGTVQLARTRSPETLPGPTFLNDRTTRQAMQETAHGARYRTEYLKLMRRRCQTAAPLCTDSAACSRAWFSAALGVIPRLTGPKVSASEGYLNPLTGLERGVPESGLMVAVQRMLNERDVARTRSLMVGFRPTPMRQARTQMCKSQTSLDARPWCVEGTWTLWTP
eukprot:scaffold50558_cov60-Phaeocystis_antarctica.AAC.1